MRKIEKITNDISDGKLYIIKETSCQDNYFSTVYYKIGICLTGEYFASYLGNSGISIHAWKNKDVKELLSIFIRKSPKKIYPNGISVYDIYEFEEFEDLCKWYTALPILERMPRLKRGLSQCTEYKPCRIHKEYKKRQ